jgi:hypothetical protein
MRKTVQDWFQHYASLKEELIVATGATEDLLHVHIGLAIFVLTALFLKRRMRSPWPLAVVAIISLANEVVDFFTHELWNWWPNALDLANTIFWPAVLFLLARRGKHPRGDKVKGSVVS